MSGTGGAPIEVLLVDDEPDFGALVADHLGGSDDLGVTVETDPRSAAGRLADGSYDCVVSDYEMPGMNGLELLAAVREDHPDLPFVLFTGEGSEAIASEAISAGVTEYMRKRTDPRQFEVLENRVRNAVEKYRAERELRRTETRYRRLVEQNLTAIVILQDGAVAYANPRAARLFGYAPGDLAGTSADALVADGERERLRAALERLESGEAEELTDTLSGVRAGGERFEFQVHGGQVTHEGDPAVLATLVDVTDSRERERELAEYRELVETVGDPTYVLDADGYVEKANAAMAEMLGYDRETLLGTHAADLTTDSGLDAGRRLVRSFLSGDRDPPETLELEFVTADGERVPCEANVTVLTGDDGAFRGTVGSVRVVADRRERERELEEYETIVRTAPDGAFIVDEDGYVVSGNDRAAELVGYDREQLVGSHYSTLLEDGVVAPEAADRYADAVESLLAAEGDDRKVELEVTLAPLDGGNRTAAVHIAPLTDDDGSFRGTVGVVRDVTERAQIADALRAERDRLSALFENVPEPALVYEFRDGEPVVRGVNDAFEATFGYDAAEVADEPLDDHVVPPDRTAEASGLNDRVAAGERLDVEIERVTADGDRRHFLLRNAPIPGDGPPRGYAIYTDVTGRKQTEQRINALFEHSTDCIVETAYVDGEPVVQRVNDAFEETFGYDASDIVGEDLDDYIAPERAREAGALNRRIREGEAIETEVTRRTADGDRDFLLRAIPFGFGDADWTYAVYTDITERKDRERRLSALHEATRRLMEATSRAKVRDIGLKAAESVLGLTDAVIYGIDEEGRALEPLAATEGAEELFGGVPTIQRGENIPWRVYESGEPVVTDDFRRRGVIYEPNTPVRSELALPLGDHGVFMAASTDVGAFGEADETLAKVLVSNVEAALDRAERETLLREREQALLRQNERLDEFAGVVSHDLRSPLTVAKGNAYLLRKNGDEAYLGKIEDALDRMERLVEDLLALARQGETVDEFEPVAVGDVAASAWESVDTAAADLAVGRLPTVEADPGRLRQLLENLFSNAVEHGTTDDEAEAAAERAATAGWSRPGDDGVDAAVTVRVGATGDGFYVEDDGPGIPEEDREKLFDAGFSTEEGGTGFGLSIVEQIAEAHGWSVEVGDSPEGGARFEFVGVEESEG